MSIDNEQHRAGFEAWWEEHGQFCRAGGGDYEKTFAYAAWMHQADSKREASAQPAAQGESIDQEKLLELILGWENSAPGSVATKAFDAIVEFIHAWGKSLATPAPTTSEPSAEPDGLCNSALRAEPAGQHGAWVSVKDRLPAAGELALVYSPPTQYDHPGSVNISFDCMDPDSDEPTWLNHNENYEHYCCVAKPEGSIGPTADAPYTHWMPVPPAPAAIIGGSGLESDKDFHGFWYGHMVADQMTGALCHTCYSTAKYVWDAATRSRAEGGNTCRNPGAELGSKMPETRMDASFDAGADAHIKATQGGKEGA